MQISNLLEFADLCNVLKYFVIFVSGCNENSDSDSVASLISGFSTTYYSELFQEPISFAAYQFDMTIRLIFFDWFQLVDLLESVMFYMFFNHFRRTPFIFKQI